MKELQSNDGDYGNIEACGEVIGKVADFRQSG